MFELEELRLESFARFSIPLPTSTPPGARGVLVVKALRGDGTGTLVVPSGIDVMLLGPVDETESVFPTVTTSCVFCPCLLRLLLRCAV